MSEGDMNEPDVVTFMAPEMRGWLWKKGEGGVFQSFHKWWFVLTDGCLYVPVFQIFVEVVCRWCVGAPTSTQAPTYNV